MSIEQQLITYVSVDLGEKLAKFVGPIFCLSNKTTPHTSIQINAHPMMGVLRARLALNR